MTRNNTFSWLIATVLMITTAVIPAFGAESHPASSPSPARAAASAKLASDLDLSSAAPVDVIIQFITAPTERHFNKVRAHGGTLRTRFDFIKAGKFSIPASTLEELSKEPEVAYISPDRHLQSMSTSSSLTLDYYPEAVSASYAWNLGLNGSGIGVAVIDSGVMNVADLGNRVVYSQNLVNNAGGSANDTYGHGTHVAGIIGGDGKDSTGSQYFYTFDGVAPNVNLVNLRVLNGTGAGQDSDVINAISQAINLKKTYNIRVINLSLGRPVEESYAQDPLCQAVESAWKAGIVVVVAAGNDGRDTTFNTNGYLTIDAPGNDPYVITVGAMNTMGTLSRADDVITSYSSKGPSPLDHIAKPDIVAPGNRITSLYGAGTYLSATYPANIDPYSLYQTGGSSSPSSEYFQLSGTSMATGVVSGAAALMLQQQPNLTPDQVKARMMISAYKAFPMYSTATDPTTGITYNEQYDVFTIGAGYLDIQTALNSSALAPNTVGAAMSPPVNYSTKNGSTTVTLVTEAPAVWSTSGAWSETNVWGTQALLNDDGVLWGNAAVWGTSSSQGFGTVWGQSVVWGKSTTDDSESSTVAIYGEN